VVMPDPAHMCKLIKNVIGEKRKMLACNNELIDFIRNRIAICTFLTLNEGGKLTIPFRPIIRFFQWRTY
jgi:hypothetical protein